MTIKYCGKTSGMLLYNRDAIFSRQPPVHFVRSQQLRPGFGALAQKMADLLKNKQLSRAAAEIKRRADTGSIDDDISDDEGGPGGLDDSDVVS